MLLSCVLNLILSRIFLIPQIPFITFVIKFWWYLLLFCGDYLIYYLVALSVLNQELGKIEDIVDKLEGQTNGLFGGIMFSLSGVIWLCYVIIIKVIRHHGNAIVLFIGIGVSLARAVN
jgi:hypothetical protein